MHKNEFWHEEDLPRKEKWYKVERSVKVGEKNIGMCILPLFN
jgi:hypothetical protein